MQVEKKLKEILSKFFLNRPCLVVDSSKSVRMTTKKLLAELGAEVPLTQTEANFSSAMGELERSKPSFIMTDYRLDNSTGFELFKEATKKFKDPRSRFFALFTATTSESVIAQAAEGDLDCFFLKPLNQKELGEKLLAALQRKIEPSSFEEMIAQGRVAHEEGKLDEAAEFFQKASGVDNGSSLGHYLLGQVLRDQKESVQELEAYTEGLKRNEKHYKCLTGKYETLMGEKKIPEAYSLSRVLAQNYPVSPDRLGELLKLAVFSGNYQDIWDYHSLYEELEVRPPQLVKTFSAAMTVCGRYLLKSKDNDEGKRVLACVAKISKNDPRFLRELIVTYCDFGFTNEAELSLKKFPDGQRDSTEFKLLDFYVAASTLEPPQVVPLASKLIDANVEDFRLFEIAIKCAVEANISSRKNAFCEKAVLLWPDKAAYFNKLVGG